MSDFSRISIDSSIMNGQPCIRGMRLIALICVLSSLVGKTLAQEAIANTSDIISAYQENRSAFAKVQVRWMKSYSTTKEYDEHQRFEAQQLLREMTDGKGSRFYSEIEIGEAKAITSDKKPLRITENQELGIRNQELGIGDQELRQDNVVQEKSYAFAVRIVNACRHLVDEKKEYVLSKQLLRSGTSIGANVEEAIGGQSGKDFFAKLCIAYKEARETHYWIRLLTDTEYLTTQQSASLLRDADELMKIIGSILKTIKANSAAKS